MSIPLDRLYHYIESLCSDDTLIYRWTPHGSKKLEDLQILAGSSWPSDVLTAYLINNLIMHDQEPLQYNLYSKQDFVNEIKRHANIRIAYKNKKGDPIPAWCKSDRFAEAMSVAHLRNSLGMPSNLNDYTLLCHSEKNSEQLKLYEENYFIGVYYWSHALIARDWFRYAECDRTLIPNFNNIKNDFLIYNRAWSGTREYRLKFIEMLTDQNLLSHCNIKFSPYDTGLHYKDHKFANPDLRINRWDFENLIPENTADSGASADYENADYQTSAIEVVLETLFDDSRQHLTEKILRPIACGRPFMLVGTPGCLQYLRDYGFKTFEGLIDESYDTIQDPVERLLCITAEMNRIASLDADAKLSLWEKLYEIAKHNQDRFFSKDFHDFVSNEFVENFERAVAFSKQHITGKWYYMYCDPNLIDDPITRFGLLENRIIPFLKKHGTFNCQPWHYVLSYQSNHQQAG